MKKRYAAGGTIQSEITLIKGGFMLNSKPLYWILAVSLCCLDCEGDFKWEPAQRGPAAPRCRPASPRVTAADAGAAWIAAEPQPRSRDPRSLVFICSKDKDP